MGYGAGFTEYDVKKLKMNRSADFPRGESEALDLIRVWAIRCEDLRLDCQWFPSADAVERWLTNYGFEIAREAVIRGIKGFSRVETFDKDKRSLPLEKHDAIYMMNYIQKVMKVLRERSEHGQKLVREGSERCYE